MATRWPGGLAVVGDEGVLAVMPSAAGALAESDVMEDNSNEEIASRSRPSARRGLHFTVEDENDRVKHGHRARREPAGCESVTSGLNADHCDDQSWLLSSVSPPEWVPNARHRAAFTESLTNVTDPSARPTMTPPEW